MFTACEFWSVAEIKLVSDTSVIIHNTVVQQRQEMYTSGGTGFRSASLSRKPHTDILLLAVHLDALLYSPTGCCTLSEEIKLKDIRKNLFRALVEYQWDVLGRNKEFLKKVLIFNYYYILRF